MYNIASVQTDKFGCFARLDVGPYYYFEVKQYLASPNNFCRLQVTPFYDLNFKKLNLNVRTQLNYFYTKSINENLFFVVNNVTWQSSKSGVSAGLNTNFQVNRSDNTNINFFIRKNFQVPVYPKKGYRNIKITLYKDADKNNVRDKNDEPIEAVKIILNNEVLQTNSNGEIYLQNILSKDIIVDLSSISNLKGWIPTEGYKQKISIGGSKNINIAFKQGKLITGKIIVDKDEHSDVLMEAANIRITATSKNNLTYSTLSDANGSYYLNVPEDEYVISINQNAIDESFKAIDPVRNIDLMNNEQVNVDFNIRQKRRQMNIIKQ